MKLGYKFSNLLGTVYKKGNIVFSKNGDFLLSPVGNRVTLFDLKSNKSRTLGLENRKDIACICLSPDSCVLIAVDDDGKSIVFSLKNDTPLHYFTFKHPIRSIKYSPDGRFIAATLDRQVQVWHAPGNVKEFAAFKLLNTHTGFYSDTSAIDWSDDSRNGTGLGLIACFNGIGRHTFVGSDTGEFFYSTLYDGLKGISQSNI